MFTFEHVGWAEGRVGGEYLDSLTGEKEGLGTLGVVCASEQSGLSEGPLMGGLGGGMSSCGKESFSCPRANLRRMRLGPAKPQQGLCGGVAEQKAGHGHACATANLRHTHYG